jgi:hypothetical protein
MELSNIKIINVSETRRGTSTTTGKPWASRSVLLGFEDNTGESYVFAQVDEDVWNSLGFQVGDVVTLNLKFRTRKFSTGFVANDIRIINPQNA